MIDRLIARAPLPLAWGFLSLGLAWFTSWLWPDGRVVPAMLAAFGLVASFVGVYRLADVVDRAARKVLERE